MSALRNVVEVVRKPSRLMTGMVAPPEPGSAAHKAFTRMASANVWVYRRTGGKVGGKLDGTPLLLLHHVGRRSGVARVMPLVYLPHGDDLVIVASMGGAPKSPAWFHNLKAAPDTMVEVGRERRSVRARVVEPDEKATLWPRLVEQYPPFAGYQKHTERDIPVVVLERRVGAA